MHSPDGLEGRCARLVCLVAGALGGLCLSPGWSWNLTEIAGREGLASSEEIDLEWPRVLDFDRARDDGIEGTMEGADVRGSMEARAGSRDRLLRMPRSSFEGE